MYRTPVRYSTHYLWNINNTPFSDSWCCFPLTPFLWSYQIGLWFIVNGYRYRMYRVRTIAYRMYRTPVRYSMHYLCNVNNTPSSDSWCCFSLTFSVIGCLQKSEKSEIFVIHRSCISVVSRINIFSRFVYRFSESRCGLVLLEAL